MPMQAPAFVRRIFVTASIRDKLFLLVLTSLVGTMLLVYGANVVLTIGHKMEEVRTELKVQAGVTSHNLEATLLFGDAKGAQEIVDSLGGNPNIISAEVRGRDGRLVARLMSGSAHEIIGSGWFAPQSLSVSHVVLVNQEALGTLTIQASLDEMWRTLSEQMVQQAAIMLLVFVSAIVLAGRLARSIVEPVGRIASIAGEITRHGNYALRVPAGASDEVGEMAHALNVMLTEIEQRDQALRIAAVAFESQEGIFVTDAEGRILRANRACMSITGYSAEEIVGRAARVLQSDTELYASIGERIRDTGSWQGEAWNQRKNGEVYPEWLTITAVRTPEGEVTHYVVTMSDITERKAAEAEITRLAFYDPLTGLPNRRLLMDRLSQGLAASNRNNRIGALMFIDLDNFKTLNDTLGHDIGDLLLQQVAQRLVACVRESDTVARLGGDEFVVLLDDLSEDHHEAVFQAEAVGEKILAALNRPYRLAQHEYSSTPSIGIILYADQQVTLDELMKRADIAMYQAKKAGRNSLRFFDPAMQAAVESRSAMERMMERALQEQQFVLYFQAQVDDAGQVRGAEALLRWQHPECGLVAPSEFIALAEETGQIVPIGIWALEFSCRLLKEWESDPRKRHLQLAVNVSPRQFRQQDFIEQVIRILRHSRIDPSRLKLELTEGMVMDNLADTIIKMRTLKETGVQFSMDDFGTGYSSLSNLRRLPFDQLKIDRSFVHDISLNGGDAVIVQTIIAMAHNLGVAVIAEGVETEQQFDFLARHGCHHFQGYLFGRPLPLKDFEKRLEW